MTMVEYSDGALQAAASTANNAANRRNDYTSNTVQNHEMASTFANSIMAEGSDLLEHLGDDEMKNEFSAFLEQQKLRLIKIAETNVLQQREVDAFCSGLQTVKGALIQQVQAEDQKPQEEQDFEKVLAASIDAAREQQATLHQPLHQEKMVRDMQTALGIVTSATSANGNESDDDLQVLPTTSVQSLKCPFSCQLFVDPIKCKVCNHVYSKQSLEDYISQAQRGRNLACPVTGCNNNHLTIESCEPDRTMAMNVKRHLRRLAHQQQVQASQAVDLDDDEEEYN